MESGNKSLGEFIKETLDRQSVSDAAEKCLTEFQKCRLQALFEHCCLHTMVNLAAREAKLDLTRKDSSSYLSLETQDLYELWLSGYDQGVVDYAVKRGDVNL